MAKKPSRQASKGNRGELWVNQQVEAMTDFTYSHGCPNLPSLDGYIQVHDAVNDTNFTVAVQVKTGRTVVSWVNNNKKKYITLRVELDDVLDWVRTNVPVIVVWVHLDPDPAKRYGLWCDPRARKLRVNPTKSGRTKDLHLRLPKNQLFDNSAREKLLALARISGGVPNVLKILTTPLYPASVKEFKKRAWNFFKQWRAEGSPSAEFRRVEVTRKCWRHLTRVSNKQRNVVHKLSLLPCARELIEKAKSSRLLRHLQPTELQEPRQLRAIVGRLEDKHQAPIMVQVVLETIGTGKARRVKLYSVYEKRSWYS